MKINAMLNFKRAAITVVAASVPVPAIAETCAELQTHRDTAISLVNTQSNALRECLIAIPNWRDEAHARYYDAYDVTETIPGKPRRLIISHGTWTSSAYVAPATRTRIERSVEYEDIGVEKRLSLFSPEDRTMIYGLGDHMKAALGDEFLLCRGKVNAVVLIAALVSFGGGFQGGPDGIETGYQEEPFAPTPGYRTIPGPPDAEEIKFPLSQRSVNRCLQREANAVYEEAAPARQAEANESHRKFMEEQREKVEARKARQRAGNWD